MLTASLRRSQISCCSMEVNSVGRPTLFDVLMFRCSFRCYARARPRETCRPKSGRERLHSCPTFTLPLGGANCIPSDDFRTTTIALMVKPCDELVKCARCSQRFQVSPEGALAALARTVWFPGFKWMNHFSFFELV